MNTTTHSAPATTPQRPTRRKTRQRQDDRAQRGHKIYITATTAEGDRIERLIKTHIGANLPVHRVHDSPEARNTLRLALDLVDTLGPAEAEKRIQSLVANPSAAARPTPSTTTAPAMERAQDWRATEARRWRETRDQFLASYPSVPATELAEITGSKAANLAQRAYAWEKSHRIFGLHDGSRKVYPLFQLRNDKPHPTVRRVLEILLPARDPWQIAIWLTTPNTWLPKRAKPLDLFDKNRAAIERAAHHEISEAID